MKNRIKSKSIVAVALVTLLFAIALLGVIFIQTAVAQASTYAIENEIPVDARPIREIYRDTDIVTNTVNVTLTAEASI
ncbi:MAG: hypothetical protein FWE84_00800 [Firmicutes bacterium]|nr:hypothetical protein [Bacillota bacterium]